MSHPRATVCGYASCVRQRGPSSAGATHNEAADRAWLDAWLAAAYAAGDDHYLSSLTATKVWRLEKFRAPDKIDLLTASTGRARLEGVRGRRTIWLPQSHVTTRGALPVTTPARTFADVCGELPIRLLRKSANDAMRRGILTPRDLALVVDEVPVSGRRKSKPLRLLVATFVPGYDPGDSDAELDVVEILVDGGYPRPDQQIEVKTERFRYYIDVGYADSKQGFEFQSKAYHDNPVSFFDDPERTSRLQRAGWTI